MAAAYPAAIPPRNQRVNKSHDELELVVVEPEQVSEPHVTVGQVTWQGGHEGALNQVVTASTSMARDGSVTVSIT